MKHANVAAAMELGDSDMGGMSGDKRMDNHVGGGHRVPQARRGNFGERRSCQCCRRIGSEHATTVGGESVVVHEPASADGGGEVAHEAGGTERLETLTDAPFVAERFLAEGHAGLADLRRGGRSHGEESEQREIAFAE